MDPSRANSGVNQGNKPMFPAESEVALMFLKPYAGVSEKKEVKGRIVSIDRPYIRPIVRGKENKRVFE